MNLEPGKFYRTRGGHKARVYAVDGCGENCNVHGAVLINFGWDAESWCADGSWCHGEENSNDLIAEWTDEPNEFEAWVKGELMMPALLNEGPHTEGWRKVKVRIVE